jgi:hypothetical protein
MKISAEGILGSAKRINRERQIDDESAGGKRQGGRVDTVEIENRVSSRLDGIQRELRELQSSLTKNQAIRDGLGRLTDELARGGESVASVLDEVRFEGRRVLRDFTGDALTPEIIRAKTEHNSRIISEDVVRLTKLQVELENILASRLVGDDRVTSIVQNFEGALAKANAEALRTISNLRPDAVMRLVRQ